MVCFLQPDSGSAVGRLQDSFGAFAAVYGWKFDNLVGRYGFYILIALVFTGITGAIIRPLAAGYMMLVNGILGLVF